MCFFEQGGSKRDVIWDKHTRWCFASHDEVILKCETGVKHVVFESLKHLLDYWKSFVGCMEIISKGGSRIS